MTVDEHKLLEDLVLDNPELEKLEELLDVFNLFEAIGAVRMELRHSDFLSFLLDPSQNHGLGDFFLKRFLLLALQGGPPTRGSMSPVHIDLWDLRGTEVRREWHSIDIVLINETLRLVAWTENKIDTTEHSKQLQRYRRVISDAFPDWIQIAIYLTPEGDLPSDDSYVAVSYRGVSDEIENLLGRFRPVLGRDLATTIDHYAQMLRRHIVSDSDIAQLASAIYRKHRRALDILYEYRPDLQTDIAAHLRATIASTAGLSLDHCSKTAIRFFPDAWESCSAFHCGDGWTPSKRLILFEFKNYPSSLALSLIVGPGDQDLRTQLHSMAGEESTAFVGFQGRLYPKWTQVFKRSFLSKSALEGHDSDQLIERIKKEWARFLERDLPAVSQSIESILAQSEPDPEPFAEPEAKSNNGE